MKSNSLTSRRRAKVCAWSEDFERVMLKIDMRTGEYDLHRAVELADRPWDGDILSTLKRGDDDEVSLLVVRPRVFGLDDLLN